MSEPTAGGVPVKKLTKAYIKLRDARAALKTQFDAQDKAFTDKMDAIKQALLDYCEEHGVESVRTEEGQFYRTVRKRYWTNDWGSMYSFILENEVPEFFEKRLNQGVVRQFLEDNPDLLPPGLNVDAEYAVTVKRK